MEKRPLLIFAHRGEASLFLKRDDFRPLGFLEGRLYKNGDSLLLLCGEGTREAAFHTAVSLGRYEDEIGEAVNLGIAGRLSDREALEEVTAIRTIYYHNGRGLEATSFPGEETAPFDLVTAEERVLGTGLRDHLAKFGDIVDREAWGIGYACKKFGKPFKAFKLVTDGAVDDDGTLCQRVRRKAPQYAQKLYEFFHRTAPPRHPLRPQETLPQGFYFTVSQKREFLRLASLLKEPLGPMVKAIPESSRPKDRTKILLERLQDKIDPFTGQAKAQLRHLAKDFENDQFRLAFDRDFASKGITLKAVLRDKNDLESLKRRLGRLPYDEIEKALGGGDVS